MIAGHGRSRYVYAPCARSGVRIAAGVLKAVGGSGFVVAA